MRGHEMRSARAFMGNMDRCKFAHVLGYTGSDKNNFTRIKAYENEKRRIPLYIARSTWLLMQFWTTYGYLPMFPNWPMYDDEYPPQEEQPRRKRRGET